VTIDEFARILEGYFGISGVRPDSRLASDLRFDSLMWLECLEMLEEAAGHPIEPDAVGSDLTVHELFLFVEQLSASDGPIGSTS